ncbi:hypothetical protein [Helicobacter japonicus]
MRTISRILMGGGGLLAVYLFSDMLMKHKKMRIFKAKMLRAM